MANSRPTRPKKAHPWRFFKLAPKTDDSIKGWFDIRYPGYIEFMHKGNHVALSKRSR